MKYNVSEIINFETIENFKIFSYFAFVASIFALCFYGFLIIYCSTKQMFTFRILMLIYIFISFLAEISFFLVKPIQLFPFNIIFPMGPLAPMSSTFVALGVMFTLFLYFPLIDILIVIVAERHFEIVSVYGSINKLQRKLIYGAMLISYLPDLYFLVNFSLSNNDDKKAKEILMENVENAEILLNFQSSLSMTQCKLNFDSLMALSVNFICTSYRIILCNWLLYENYNYAKNTVISLSNQTKKQFSLMLQTTFAQGAAASTAGASGGVWLFLYLIPNYNYPTISLIATGMAILYPVIDVMVIIIVVKPYREVVKKMLTFKFSFKERNYGNHRSIRIASVSHR